MNNDEESFSTGLSLWLEFVVLQPILPELVKLIYTVCNEIYTKNAQTIPILKVLHRLLLRVHLHS